MILRSFYHSLNRTFLVDDGRITDQKLFNQQSFCFWSQIYKNIIRWLNLNPETDFWIVPRVVTSLPLVVEQLNFWSAHVASHIQTPPVRRCRRVSLVSLCREKTINIEGRVASEWHMSRPGSRIFVNCLTCTSRLRIIFGKLLNCGLQFHWFMLCQSAIWMTIFWTQCQIIICC